MISGAGLLILNSILMSPLNICTFLTSASICFLFSPYNFRSSMKRRWLTFPRRSPNWYPTFPSLTTNDMGVSANTKSNDDELYHSNMHLFILAVLSFFLPDVSSFFHFLMLLPNTFGIFSATPNIPIHFFNQLLRTMSKVFLESIHSIPNHFIHLLQFFNIILSINNWSFVALDFIQNLFCFLGNNLSLSRWSCSLSLSIPVNIFHIRSKHAIDLKLVMSFSLSLSFIISTILLVVSQSGVSFISKHNCTVQLLFHGKM